MNLALSDEQEFLREAARGALSRVKTIEAAREALEGTALPDLWPTVVEAGWPGLLIDEDRGGAGLSAFDAMLVAQECGRVLAGAPLLGLLGAGELWYRQGQDKHYLSLAFGFAEVGPDRVTILAQIAEKPHEIDLARAEAAKKRAEERLSKPTMDLDFERARIALLKSLIRLQVAARTHTRVSRTGVVDSP